MGFESCRRLRLDFPACPAPPVANPVESYGVRRANPSRDAA